MTVRRVIRRPSQFLSQMILLLETTKQVVTVMLMHLLRKEQNLMKKVKKKCIFLRYSDVTKGYKLFDFKTNKLVVSRDVIFDEKQHGIGRIKR